MESLKKAYQLALMVWLQHPMLVVVDVVLAITLVVWVSH